MVTIRSQWQKRIKRKPLSFAQWDLISLKGCHRGPLGPPATFQRLMEKAVGDMHMLEVIVYLDNMIILGKTLEGHEQRLLKVIDRLGEAGLKLSIGKCQFFNFQL